MAKRGRELKHTRGLAVCYYRDIGGGFRELDGSNSPPPTALYAPRVGGRICQAVTFVLVGCAGQQKATSRPCAREEDRGPRRSSTKGQIVEGISDRPLLYASGGGATSARRASFVPDCCAGCQADFSHVWRARRRAGAMPIPTRSENRTQNHDEREVPVLPTSLTGRAGGRICQAVTFVLVGCAGQQKATSPPCACEEDRVHTGPQRKARYMREISGRTRLYAPRGGATSVRWAVFCPQCSCRLGDGNLTWLGVSKRGREIIRPQGERWAG